MDYEINLEIEYIYIINQDLKMSKGKIASQVSHVAMMLAVDSIFQYNTYDLPTLHNDYHYIIGKSIVLKAPESLLKQIVNNNYKDNSHIFYIEDAGLTEVPKGSLTCVGFCYDATAYYKDNAKLREMSKTLQLV